MKVHVAILIVIISAMLFGNSRLAETAAHVEVDAQQIKDNFRYTCNGETLVVYHCRHEDDNSQFPPTKPENDYCRVFYPDRPLRNGFKVETVELFSDVIRKLQSCGAIKAALNTPSNTPSTITPPANADVNNTIVAYLNQGDQYRAGKNYPEAIAAYQKAISLKPSIGAYSRLGVVYLEDLKQYPKALSAFQSALRLVPEDATLHFDLGRTYSKMGQYENAVNEYKEALRFKPDFANASNSLGLVYFELDQYSEALAAQKEAVRLEPNNPTFIENLLFNYLDLGRKEEALAVCKELQRVAPDKAKDLYKEINLSFAETDDVDTNLGLAMQLLSDLGARGYTNALRIFRRVVLLKAPPDLLGIAHQRMAEIYTKQKKPKMAAAEYDKATLAYQEAIRLKPREAENYLYLGEVYVSQGRKDAALRVYQTLRTLDPAQAKKLYDEINAAQTPPPAVDKQKPKLAG